MSPEKREKRPPVLHATAIAVSLVVVAVLGGLMSACLGSGDPVVVPEVTPERGGAWPPPPRSAASADAGELVIELRVWQHVEDPWDVWVHARPQGGGWETPGPTRFPLDEAHPNVVEEQGHSYRDIAIAGVELRLWQRHRAPELIYVRACLTPCWESGTLPAETDLRRDRGVEEYWPWQAAAWNPLGMIPIPLDDRPGEFGGYRSGDLAIAVPVGNPGLAADREYLLALRGALAGTATLNWSAGTPTSEWEGVRLTGWPRRVMALDLADRGLDGEIWGWLGELNELTELRLDGNRLAGTVPTKLAMLSKLTQLGLSGNELVGCVPPPLRNVAYHDLARLGLPDCDPPSLLFEDDRSPGRYVTPRGEDSYYWRGGVFYRVFDLPARSKFHSADPGFRVHWEWGYPGADGADDKVRVSFGHGNWLKLNGESASESGRSHYAEDDPAIFAILEQIAASVWHNGAVDDGGEWVWP